ncbi:hypothetical protein CRUP_003222 [Coryphaenoides rupestris]|nr:hypothetical protein CRUP_003222 [Coryphaenoides rupestris]
MASRSPSSSPDSATGSGTDPARPDTGEPLGGAGSDSDDSSLDLARFDCDCGGGADAGSRLEGEELQEEFEQAWKQLGDMEAEQAMQEYIVCVNTLDPEGSVKVMTSERLTLYGYKGRV